MADDPAVIADTEAGSAGIMGARLVAAREAIRRFLSGLWAYRSASTYRRWLKENDGGVGGPDA